MLNLWAGGDKNPVNLAVTGYRPRGGDDLNLYNKRGFKIQTVLTGPEFEVLWNNLQNNEDIT